ncbi:PEP-CTERM sorting domain-containing protein [Thalassotalea piscium]
MLKKIVCSALLLLSQSSFAGIIELAVDQNNYQINDVITAQVIVKDFNQPLAGAFTELVFDENALSLISWQFSGAFDDGFGSFQFDDDTKLGALYLEDIADVAADFTTLASLQANAFILATIQFTVMAEGFFELALNEQVSGALSIDNDLLAITTGNTSFNVGATTAVPEPSTFILMFLGFYGFISVKKRYRK